MASCAASVRAAPSSCLSMCAEKIKSMFSILPSGCMFTEPQKHRVMEAGEDLRKSLVQPLAQSSTKVEARLDFSGPCTAKF